MYKQKFACITIYVIYGTHCTNHPGKEGSQLSVPSQDLFHANEGSFFFLGGGGGGKIDLAELLTNLTLSFKPAFIL